ncbi:glycosyl transferase, group 1 [Desulfovibrio sp. DV]|uniref:glycosyltransferase n=1 Tax=Desulfovibrio sp. DV TaxID=1844708 RepID=UPI00094BB972|nr:glycosyltransferase [Desulfovibrio sp. DV]OLN27987.1 glycosyl transferase, group 1 [Desulfovibrio sp. DV]
MLMEAMVAEAGLSDRVALLGRRDDVREWLGAADIFVLPSDSEGMPLCITEAMGQGLPVVASAVSGIPEQLGGTGILLPDPAIDPEATALALATALAALAGEPATRQTLGQAGRERARSHFTAPAMIRSWLDLLASLAPALAGARVRYPDPAGYLPPNAAPFGQDIPIGDDLAAAEFLKEGWSHGEGAGRWTEGGRARLALGLPEAARDGFVLELNGRPFLGRGDTPLALTVTVCGREAGRFAWPGSPQPLAAALACLPGTGRFAQQAVVTLAIDGASSPAAHAISDDPRPLGFFLAGLRLTPLSRPGVRP